MDNESIEKKTEQQEARVAMPNSSDRQILNNQFTKTWHKSPFIIIFLLFIIIFGIGYIILVMRKTQHVTQNSQSITKSRMSRISPTVVPTTSLKTYTNDQLGLSFTFPGNWTTTPYEYNYSDDTNTSIGHGVIGLIPVSFKEKYPTTVGLLPFISVVRWDNPHKLSLQAYNKQVPPQSSDIGLFTSNTQSVSIAGKTAYHDPKADCDPLFCDRYIFPSGNTFIVIQRFYPNASDTTPDAIEEGIFSQIISSVHF